MALQAQLFMFPRDPETPRDAIWLSPWERAESEGPKRDGASSSREASCSFQAKSRSPCSIWQGPGGLGQGLPLGCILHSSSSVPLRLRHVVISSVPQDPPADFCRSSMLGLNRGGVPASREQ